MTCASISHDGRKSRGRSSNSSASPAFKASFAVNQMVFIGILILIRGRFLLEI